MTYLWVALGSALGGIARYGITRLTLSVSATFPWGTFAVNVIGCFIMGFVGTMAVSVPSIMRLDCDSLDTNFGNSGTRSRLAGKHMSQCHREDAESNGKSDVGCSLEPISSLRYRERIQAERRECREAAANPDHQKEACALRNREPSAPPNQESNFNPRHKRKTI
jgi:hypothetical protein